jgi:hypothetical protein
MPNSLFFVVEFVELGLDIFVDLIGFSICVNLDNESSITFEFLNHRDCFPIVSLSFLLD